MFLAILIGIVKYTLYGITALFMYAGLVGIVAGYRATK